MSSMSFELELNNATMQQTSGIVTPHGVVPLAGKEKPSMGAHKAKHPPGRALTQCGTTQRRPARWPVGKQPQG